MYSFSNTNSLSKSEIYCADTTAISLYYSLTLEWAGAIDMEWIQRTRWLGDSFCAVGSFQRCEWRESSVTLLLKHLIGCGAMRGLCGERREVWVYVPWVDDSVISEIGSRCGWCPQYWRWHAMKYSFIKMDCFWKRCTGNAALGTCIGNVRTAESTATVNKLCEPAYLAS
jgi:hypothetical protein